MTKFKERQIAAATNRSPSNSEQKIHQFRQIKLPEIVNSPREYQMQSPEEKNAFGKLQSIFNRSDRKHNVRLSFQSATNYGLDKVP